MQNKRLHISRRSFLRTCSLTATAAGLPAWFIERELSAAEAGTEIRSPNERAAIALIGCGGMGRGDAQNAQRFGDLVAVCDVDRSHAEAASKQFTKDGKVPAIYSDFRKLLERNDIQVVVAATPDHWHTLVNLACVKAGKDVYGEKPLTLTIDEGKHLVQAVRGNKRVFQTGSQQRSDARFRLACELVRNQRIGKLKQVIAWLPAGLREGPFKSVPVPKELDWDFWQGQAPGNDYMPQRCHLYFRYWYDYAGGTMTDWGAHHNDIARWAIGADAPETIEAKALAQPVPGGYTAISEYDVKYTYAGGAVHVARSTKADNIYGGVDDPDGQRNGVRFEGAEGWIWVNRGSLQASDKSLIETPLPDSAQRLPVSNDHMGNFFDCVRSRKAPIAEPEVGHRSATVCHLGNIALRTGLKLQWDGARQEFTGENARVANGYLAREMRKPYDYSFI